MTVHEHGRRVAVGVVLVGMALAGCGPAAQQAEQPTTSSTPRTAAPTSSSASASATPTATSAAAPPVGSQLVPLPATGNSYVLSNTSDAGFSVLTRSSSGSADASTLTAYDVAGRALGTVPAGSFDGQCGAVDVSPSGRRLLITATLSSVPAQGVVPASYSETLTARDARTGTQVWTAPVLPPQADQISCSGRPQLEGVTATTDGAVAALDLGEKGMVGIDLGTGQLYPKDDLLGRLGVALVTGRHDSDGRPDLMVLTTPPAWAGLGSFSSGSDPGLVPVSTPGDVSWGLFGSGGSTAAAGLSPDGTVLYTAQASDAGGRQGTVLTAWSLPAMNQLWRRDTATDNAQYSLVGAGSGVLLAERRGSDRVETTEGLDARTGQTLWTLPGVRTCGISTTQLLVTANDQVAVIDLATGRQLSFSGQNGSSSCPTVLRGGRALVSTTTGTAVTQVLAP